MKTTSNAKHTVLFLSTLLTISALAVFTSADCIYPTEPADFDVVVDGFAYEGEVLSVKDIAYVSLREFACMADNSVVWWEEDEAAAYVRTDSLDLRAPEDEFYIEANGRMLWCEYGVFTEDDILYIPLGKAAKAFGFDTTYVYEDSRPTSPANAARWCLRKTITTKRTSTGCRRSFTRRRRANRSAASSRSGTSS